MTQTSTGYFNPSFHFLGLIQKTIMDGVTRHCVQPGCPDVYLAPKEQAYYVGEPDIQALKALCLAEPFDMSVRLMPDWHPPGNQLLQAGRLLMSRKNQAAGHQLEKRPLDELLWYAALVASDGRLWQGCHAETPVSLKVCPDFSRLFHRECDPVLATSLLEGSASLTAVAEKAHVPLAHVFEFYNACTVLDLIEFGSTPEDVFEPRNYLLGLIDTAASDRQARCCTLAGGPPLYIVPEEDKYFCEGDALAIAKFCTARLSDLQVTVVGGGKDEVVQIGRQRVVRKKTVELPKIPGQPLSLLRFRAALYGSQGRLLRGFTTDTPVSLKSWPDKALVRESSTIKAERHIVPLSAFMVNKSASLPEIATAAQLPLDKVIDFHNACALAGLLKA